MSNDEEENVAEEKVTEEETETKDEEKEEEKGDTGRRCHARMSVVSRQQQKIDADVYMAKKSIGEILQWITIPHTSPQSPSHSRTHAEKFNLQHAACQIREREREMPFVHTKVDPKYRKNPLSSSRLQPT